MSFLRSTRNNWYRRGSYLSNTLENISMGIPISRKEKETILREFKTLGPQYLIPSIKRIKGEEKYFLENLTNDKSENILFIAAHRHDPSIFNATVEALLGGITLSQVDRGGCCIYMHLLKDGDTQKLRYLSKMPPPDFKRTNYKGETLDSIAKKEGTLDMLEVMRNFEEARILEVATDTIVSTEKLLF